MLARTAVQPRVLVALIQCATLATEVVEIATESEEGVVINCVAIFYEEGKGGKNFRKKNNKFRCYSGPPGTCGFGKIRCGLRFFGVFLCGFAVFGPPLRPPHCLTCKKSLCSNLTAFSPFPPAK